MANAYHDQNGIVSVPPNRHQLFNPIEGVFYRPLGFVVNPNFRPFLRLVPFNLHLGFSLPLHYPSLLFRMDFERSSSLAELLANEGLVPSTEEELKRRSVIGKLKEIVLMWIKKVAWQRRLPNNVIGAVSATILTYGSYGLGVYGQESDIDALCIGPWFATMSEDFFTVLCNILKSRPEVADVHCVKDAKVPLMRFKFEGVPIDLPYARLQLMSVPENVDLLNPVFMEGIDETSWKCLSGVRVNQRILQLVPNLQNFQSLLRCIKLWAKRRGVYGNLFGYLGGVHLAILAAFVCQRNPEASLSALVVGFFNTFAVWPWPTPVVLHDEQMSFICDPPEKWSWMPIRLPCSPYEYCHSNITRSTFTRIRAELLRAKNIIKDLLRPEFEWGSLFEPFVYPKRYSQFVKIYLSASSRAELGDWVGWVKSRFRTLVLKLEEVQGFCDPNPTEYPDGRDPNVVFYWGLHPNHVDAIDIDSVEEDFLNNIVRGHQGLLGHIELHIVEASEVPSDTVLTKRTKACWRIPEPRVPVYSHYLPHYFVGYTTSGRDSSYGPV